MENIEYRYYVDKDMTKEIFEKFLQRLHHEQKEIEAQLSQLGKNISNASEAIAKALKLFSEVATVWSSGEIGFKEKLQKRIFPKGIVYDRENKSFRTPGGKFSFRPHRKPVGLFRKYPKRKSHPNG